MDREVVPVVREETAEVHDLPHPFTLSRTGEVVREHEVEVGERPLRELGRREHRVDEVDRVVGVVERLLELKEGKEVTAPPLDGVSVVLLRRPRRRPRQPDHSVLTG